MTTPGPTAAGPAPVELIGLDREREVLTVALRAGRHVVLEGPPGVGKSTLLRTIAARLGTAMVFVEGNAELTPARLVGQHDPAQVLREGYVPEAFVDGPLLAAMRRGALLYLEELNRVPEETMNVLITVLTEGEIAVPRLGAVTAAPGFRLIAAMNPFDAIGTARVGQAIADRMCRVVLDYAAADAERLITGQQAAAAAPAADGPPDPALVDLAVRLARATREHPDLRTGSSVRGSIDLVLLLDGLLRLRANGAAAGGGARSGAAAGGLPRQTVRDAAHAALSGRVRVADGCDRTPESVIDDLVDRVLAEPAEGPDRPDQDGGDPGGPPPGDGPPPPAGRGKAEAPGESRSALRRHRRSGPARRQASRAELAVRHPGFEQVSPQVGELDADALAGLMGQDPEAAAALLADLALATDAELRAAATRLAARVFVRLGRTVGQRTRGTRRLAPNRRGDGDLDLERTLDRWADGIRPGSARPDAEHLVTRSWAAHRRALALLVDRSGSMGGLAVALAAVSAAAVVQSGDGVLSPAVLVFGAEVSTLQRWGSRRPAEDLVGDLVRLRGHGTTDLAGALRAASAELARVPGADERVVVLLSDCRHTVGGDPAEALAGIDRLHVLCPLPGDRPPDPEAETLAAALARRGGGLARPVRLLSDIPASLTAMLG